MHVKQLRQWLGLSQLQMAKELALSSNSAVSYYENDRPADPIKGLMVDRLKQLANRANAKICDIPDDASENVISLTGRGTPVTGNVEDEMNKPTRENIVAKVDGMLSAHASDDHSDIQHLFVVSLDDGGILYRSESVARNPPLADAISLKYSEDTNFLKFMLDPRNLFHLTRTTDWSGLRENLSGWDVHSLPMNSYGVRPFRVLSLRAKLYAAKA